MSTVTLLIVIVVVVVVVAALAVAVSAMLRKRRSDRLREEFGPEYERTMRESDDPREAEADLRRREKQRSRVQLRELDESERAGYRERWDTVQREFVDDPGRAVTNADRLVVDVMSARGYPAEDVDRRADDLSVDFPVITQRYREAREVSRAHEAGRADTEDLRHAVTSYRELVHALLDDDGSGRDGAGARAERDGRPRDGRGAAALERDAGRGPDADRDRDGVSGRDADLDGPPVRDAGSDRDAGRGRDTDRDRDGVSGRDADPARDGHTDPGRDAVSGRDRDPERDGHADPGRDGVAGRDADRGRDPERDGSADRNGERGRDGRSVREIVRDTVTRRENDGRDGHGGDDRRVRDVVRDRLSGRDGAADRDAGAARDTDGDPDGDPRAQPWERGRHAHREARPDDGPRRGATT